MVLLRMIGRLQRFILLGLWPCALSYALAFGIEPAERGVGTEHERITRAAIGDVDPTTLDELAGSNANPGAVGAPDLASRGLVSDAASHCDGGDYLAVAPGAEPYGKTQQSASNALTACRALIFAELENAVAAAKDLSNPTEANTSLGCKFDGTNGEAKCNVLQHLGLAFHAAQDFYAHTNWVDQPAAGPITARNPPGLGKTGRAWWLDPRATMPFPTGLISGCQADCEDWLPIFGQERITRADLGKDLGPIGNGRGGLGMTPRGAINNNFQRAVSTAVADTSDKWDYFKERIRAVYPGDAGETILCALANDKFDKATCGRNASRASVCAARRTAYVDEDEATLPSFAQPSQDELAQAESLWEPLRQYCRLEEAGLTRDAVINGGIADEGRARGKASAVAALALWNACPAEGRAYLEIEKDDHNDGLRELTTKTPRANAKLRALLASTYADCIVAARIDQLRK